MAKNLINKYVWLVETIYRSRRITFDEINEKWKENDLSDGSELPLRTFHKWRIAVEEMFGLVIDCERRGGYHYYIANADELKGGCIRNWLLNTISVSNLLIDNQHIKDRILLEDIPSGQEYLATIIDAIKTGSVLTMTYRSYWREECSTFDVEPYCVKLFKQRWYVIGRSPYNKKMYTYALDRIIELNRNSELKFKMPKSFSPEDYFYSSFGVIVDYDTDEETVVLKVSAQQANYIRAVPMHHSQRETERTSDYSIFKMRLRPTFDFWQEILWHGEELEVLEPLWLREEIAMKIEKMSKKYRS